MGQQWLRPLIFNEDSGGKLLYFADQLPGDARRVKGVTNTPPTRWAVTVHELPPAGGRLKAKGQMTSRLDFARPRFDRNTQKSEMTVDVRILDLVELPPGPGTYVRCAITLGCVSDSPDGPTHLRVVFGKQGLVNRLIGLAAAHRAVVKFNDRVLRISDMSLPKGGQFDLGPPLGVFWASPHKAHRRGTGADISRFTLLDGTVSVADVDQEVLDDFVKKLGLRRHTEISAKECPQIGAGPPCIHLEL